MGGEITQGNNRVGRRLREDAQQDVINTEVHHFEMGILKVCHLKSGIFQISAGILMQPLLVLLTVTRCFPCYRCPSLDSRGGVQTSRARQ